MSKTNYSSLASNSSRSQQHSSSRSQHHSPSRPQQHPLSTSNHRSAREHSSSDSQHRSSCRSRSYSRYSSSQGLSSQHHRQTSPGPAINSQELINSQHQVEYPLFHVPSSIYELVFINDHKTTSTLDRLLDHAYHCHQYSIDTESERTNNKLALIQINSIPINPPSIVILCELEHLPDLNSYKYKKIHELFRLIFRSNNEIYSWGRMDLELKPERNLLTWPIQAELINIQPHFNTWYSWARTQCRVQCLVQEEEELTGDEVKQQHDQQIPCNCHLPSPYRLNEIWSLQKALQYAGKYVIDKSCQRSHWSASLSSNRSSLSSSEQRKMIHYAVHDTLAVTYLIRPIIEQWTFERIQRRRLDEVFTSFKSTKIPSITSLSTTKKKKKVKNINLSTLSKSMTNEDMDTNSDGEIYLSQIIEPKQDKPEQDNDDIYKINLLEAEHQPSEVFNDEPDETLQQQPLERDEHEPGEQLQQQQYEQREEKQNQLVKTKRLNKSNAWKKKQNKRHNDKAKKGRYRYKIRRDFYPQFTMPMVRFVLHRHGIIQFKHIKIDEDTGKLVIGMKTEDLRQETEHRLPMKIFTETNYDYYRRKYYRRRR